MGDSPARREDPAVQPIVAERLHRSGIVLFLVTLALILAIGFFYMTNENRQDRQADAVTQAADQADDAVELVGGAAKNAADTLRNGN